MNSREHCIKNTIMNKLNRIKSSNINHNSNSVYKNIILDSRELCDLELLLNGAFSPLDGFLKEEDYNSVLLNLRLKSGELWPMPIVLAKKDKGFSVGETVNLCNSENLPIASMTLESIYQPDLDVECNSVFGSIDTNHPYIQIIKNREGLVYLGGRVEKINGVPHFDFDDLRLTPTETKKYFKDNNWDTVVGFQTRNPMHKSHYFLSKYALEQTGIEDAKVLIHPVVGVTQTCDIDYHTRVRCYKKIMEKYEPNTAKLSLLPLSMRMAGPREAVWHALIRKNYGCTHFVVGRDHAGPSFKKENGESFFGPYDAQDLLMKYAGEIGISVITSKLIVYATPKSNDESESSLENGIYSPIDALDKEKYDIHAISGTQQRKMLRDGDPIPEWFSFPEVVSELTKGFRPKNRKGFCVYLVGLSGSGKTTIAKALHAKLLELEAHRKITLLDGDVVRQNLSKGLKFTKEDRSTNVRRIGYVASEVVKHSGIVICANIAPYEDDRNFNRDTIEKHGNYIEIFVNTSLDECERRDVKGLYKKARSGIIPNFTGISDPFEEPSKPELKLDGNTNVSLRDNINSIIEYLQNNSLL
jgi:sulfate adenylyltransferase